ncbi:hypothetical protein SCOR_04660 [Sulfidibacter corallicola]|uniref:Uncharacterized protein n=1 Tax=Sulfidibacter corallicola TaxID=2818388 RepID=A0A8A4TZJ9_SULCO|nr:hypothetical protein [Sulfidibacter corallicola]QTD51935.1 hypothetical protein J3U87_05635 [Sulfidibacter corallicola]
MKVGSKSGSAESRPLATGAPRRPASAPPKRESPPAAEPFEGHTRAAGDALRALVRDLYADRFGRARHSEEPWELDIKLRVDPSRDWQVQFEPDLVGQLVQQFERLEARVGQFTQGRIYCFQCGESECEHALPRSPLEVFDGYDPVGCPRWAEMAQFLLDLKDERVGELFDSQPRILTRQVSGRELRERQLSSFGRGSKTYALLGQVVVGYLSWVDRDSPDERQRLAVTYQAVETRALSGHSCLDLNTLFWRGDAKIEDIVFERFGWLERAARKATESLKGLEAEVTRLRSAGRGNEARRCMRRVPDILRTLAADVQQGHRQSKRRTRHAQVRRVEQRPVDKAMADLERAKFNHMFRDTKKDSFVLRGERGRCHVFNGEGRHITSFTIGDEATRIRVRKKRWVPLLKREFEDLMDRFYRERAGEE